MPFDPSIPKTDSKMKSIEMREQFTSLKSLIDDQGVVIAGQATVIANQSALITGLQTQIDALADTIGSLSARIAALEAAAVNLTATGFGEDGANGKLTVIGTFAGKPMYQAAGGWYYCWNDYGGMWICRDAMPGTGDLSNNRYADSGYAAEITAVTWGPGFNPGMSPFGTVS